MDKFLDNLKKGVKVAVSEAEKLTKVVADKTSNIVDVTKLNISLSDTEKKINKLYASIGEIVYADFANDTQLPEKLTELCEQIAEFKNEADSIRGQIAELKASVACPACGVPNGKESEYCSKCGAKLTGDKEEDMVIEVTDFPED